MSIGFNNQDFHLKGMLLILLEFILCPRGLGLKLGFFWEEDTRARSAHAVERTPSLRFIPGKISDEYPQLSGNRKQRIMGS